MNRVLMRAIVEGAVFAGLSGDDAIQPDAAVSYLEQLAFTLKALSVVERNALADFAASLAMEERAAGRVEQADFIDSLCNDLGLTDPRS